MKIWIVAVGVALATSASLVASAQSPAGDDVVYLANGGRLRGTVIEEDPSRGVRIQLADGTVQTVPAADVTRVAYGGAGAAQPTGPAPAAPPAVPPGGPGPGYGAPGYGPGAGWARGDTYTRETRGIPGLYIAGPIVLGVAWLTTIAVTTAINSEGGVEDSEAKAIGYACIPIAGPWAMMADSDVDTRDYTAPLVVSGVLQGAGLAMTILGLTIRREVRVPSAIHPARSLTLSLHPVPTPSGGGLMLSAF